MARRYLRFKVRRKKVLLSNVNHRISREGISCKPRCCRCSRE